VVEDAILSEFDVEGATLPFSIAPKNTVQLDVGGVRANAANSSTLAKRI
jgi:hypothetical protein